MAKTREAFCFRAQKCWTSETDCRCTVKQSSPYEALRKPFCQILCIRGKLNNKLLRSQWHIRTVKVSVAAWVRFAKIWHEVQHLYYVNDERSKWNNFTMRRTSVLLQNIFACQNSSILANTYKKFELMLTRRVKARLWYFLFANYLSYCRNLLLKCAPQPKIAKKTIKPLLSKSSMFMSLKLSSLLFVVRGSMHAHACLQPFSR